MNRKDRFRGCLLGLAAGDAVGTAVEFRPRESFKPLTDLKGGGPFCLKPGQWTDDTAMALCLATSLVKSGGFDARDQMERYCRWFETGYLSSTGTCFDAGRTVVSALRRFRSSGEPFAGLQHPRSAGNGSIMRLAPIPMFFFPDTDTAEQFAAESSRTTHGARECLDACRLLARIIMRALLGHSKEAVVLGDGKAFKENSNVGGIARGIYRWKPETKIRGSGYVVESLEAAMWCFVHTNNFKDAVLKAANLGDDADTTAAVCGQVAGAFYGLSGIPSTWQKKLALETEIRDLADQLLNASKKKNKDANAKNSDA